MTPLPTLQSVRELGPCSHWTDERISTTCTAIAAAPMTALLLLAPRDARWYLSRVMSSTERLIGAKECARRAKEHFSALSTLLGGQKCVFAHAAHNNAAELFYHATRAGLSVCDASLAAGYAFIVAEYVAMSVYCLDPTESTYEDKFAAAEHAGAAEHRLYVQHACQLLGWETL